MSKSAIDGHREALVADRVSKRFGAVVALDDVSLERRVGRVRGARRREWIRKVDAAALLQPSRRSGFRVCASERRRRRAIDAVALRRRIGYVPQDGGLLPHWRVQRNVELVLRLNGDANAAARARAALSLVGLEPEKFARSMAA